jgi:hypothetical protein
MSGLSGFLTFYIYYKRLWPFLKIFERLLKYFLKMIKTRQTRHFTGHYLFVSYHSLDK